MMSITAAQIERLCPTARADLVFAVISGWPHAEAAGIATPLRVQMFLATLAVETGGLRSIDENLNYTTAARLMAVWPSRFPTEASARPYIREPEKLANKVYANRLGNGPPSSGDGWRYRGGGFIQNTGRDNYRKVGHEHDPETLRQPDAGFRAAVDWWVATGCNEVADKDNPLLMRKKVNGGVNGLAEFEGYLAKARNIFATVQKRIEKPAQPVSPPPAAQTPPPGDGRFTPQEVKQKGVQGGIAVVVVAFLGALAWLLSKIFGGD